MSDLRQQLPEVSPNDIMQIKLLLQIFSNLGMADSVDVVTEDLAKLETKAKESIGCSSEPDYGERS